MLIATISSCFSHELSAEILDHPLVGAVRFNTGAPSAESAYDVLSQLKGRTDKPIWVDLKCKQLRVIRWCAPNYGLVQINHPVEIKLPAKIHFRGADWVDIKAVEDNMIYLTNPPKVAIGQGQAVNIQTASLTVNGYHTEEDISYIQAAENLGMHYFMLSFYEGSDDLRIFKSNLVKPGKAQIGLKIESKKGIEAVEELHQDIGLFQEFPVDRNLQIVVARDDLLINLKEDPTAMISVLERCIEVDKNAIAASHILSGLENKGITASDISDIHLLHIMGYKNFLLSDGICQRHFGEAISTWQQYKELRKE